jgi:hypothetical protein
MSVNILDEEQIVNNNLRRRDLLPTWIKVFTWIFLIFGAMTPVILILGVMGINVNISLYGLETNQPLSLLGIAIIILFAIKGIVAFGLWTEKEWAVNMAMTDAGIGITVCALVMIILPFIFRFEFVISILYLVKMIQLKPEWLQRSELKKN